MRIAGFQSGKAHGKGVDDASSPGDLASITEQGSFSPKGIVTLILEVRGAKSVNKLVARLGEIDGVVAVQAGNDNSSSE